jgi:hypothetical protein
MRAGDDVINVTRPAHLNKSGTLKTKVRRGFHIAVVFWAVLLLALPSDCFTSRPADQKAAECCKKGKCNPSNSDDCCRATVPGDHQLVASKEIPHALPALAVVPAYLPMAAPQPFLIARFVEIHQPPGSPPNLRLNLPLLI